jgi:hypothetical protein
MKNIIKVYIPHFLLYIGDGSQDSNHRAAQRAHRYLIIGDPGGGCTRRAPPPKIGKNMIFWRKIVIFHTKFPKNVRVSLRSVQFF